MSIRIRMPPWYASAVTQQTLATTLKTWEAGRKRNKKTTLANTGTNYLVSALNAHTPRGTALKKYFHFPYYIRVQLTIPYLVLVGIEWSICLAIPIIAFLIPEQVVRAWTRKSLYIYNVSRDICIYTYRCYKLLHEHVYIELDTSWITIFDKVHTGVFVIWRYVHKTTIVLMEWIGISEIVDFIRRLGDIFMKNGEWKKIELGKSYFRTRGSNETVFNNRTSFVTRIQL